MILKAKWVFPVSSAPIENAFVSIEGDRIAYVGTSAPGRTPGSHLQPVVELGDVVLLPGLVNAHCHLEHSALKGLTTPGLPFTEWVKEVAHQSAALSKGDLRAGEKHALETLVRGGTTTLADHASPDSDPIETSLRRIPFWEVLGAHEGRARESLEKARIREKEEGGHVTPHSLYAVHEEVLEEIFKPHFEKGGPGGISLHLLESADEDQFFHTQTGPLAVYVQERGGDLAFPLSSPVPWLAANHGLLNRILLVHGNHLNPAEIAALRGTGAFVIHCPGSHRFFGHRPFPLRELQKAGVPVALGTDSLASNEDLSMLREMRLLKESFPELTGEEILKMATLEGARALGMEKEIGTLEVGKKADLIAIKGDFLRAVSVVFSMIDGKVALTP